MKIKTSSHLLKNFRGVFEEFPETVIVNKNEVIGAVLRVDLWEHMNRTGVIKNAIQELGLEDPELEKNSDEFGEVNAEDSSDIPRHVVDPKHPFA